MMKKMGMAGGPKKGKKGRKGRGLPPGLGDFDPAAMDLPGIPGMPGVPGMPR